jgi:NADH-quinone oxidoreductase subunit M
MPIYATVSLIAFMSSMGLPLLNGFVGEITILQGVFMESKAWAAWAVPGIILGAAYLLWLYQRVYFGPVKNPKNQKLLDLSGREIAVFTPLLVLAFVIGLYPKPLYQILDQPVNSIVAKARPGYPLKASPTATEARKMLPAPTPATPQAVLAAREEVPQAAGRPAEGPAQKPAARLHTQLIKPAALAAVAGK